MRFGVHVSISGGLERAVERAVKLGCDCFQVFVGNPRGWRSRPLGDREAARFRAARAAAGLGPVVVHLTYLPNLASPEVGLWRRSCAALLEQYRAAAALEAEFFVLHPGSGRGGDRETAVLRAAEALARVLARVPAGPVLLLENTVGGGDNLGAEPRELAAIDRAVGSPARVGVCFDTAHAHAAGTDLARAGAMARVRRQYRAAFDRHPIRLLHLNDLRAEPGARRDRHEHIGRGTIGEEAFARLLATPGVRSLPCILETPVENDGDDRRNLARARALAAGG